MYTFSGALIDEKEGAPTIKDVAIAMGRTPRLCGAGRVWWSYLHYSYALVEMALLENAYYNHDAKEVVIQALIREAHSAITLLWEPGRDFKDSIQERIYEAWGVKQPHPDSEMKELIDRAATRTFLAEVECFAPKAMKDLPIFGDASFKDCKIVRGIWERRHAPEHSAETDAEMVKAYIMFFKEKDIARLRHMIGYDRKIWFQELCGG